MEYSIFEEEEEEDHARQAMAAEVLSRPDQSP